MQIRVTTSDDLDVFVRTLHTAFGRFPESPNEDGGGVFWAALEMDRNLLAVAEDGRPVGTTASYSFELTLPGGAIVPTTGVTNVGVVPSHRRRGIMTALLRRQLADVQARGEFIAVLAATEATIYRRFGFGPATFTRRLTVPRHRAALAPRRSGNDAGSIHVTTRAECGELLERVYDQYRRAQPGGIDRPHRFWSLGAGEPPVSHESRFIAIHSDANGEPDGYAAYSIDGGTLTIDETIATNDVARTELDRFVHQHDLVSEIVFNDTPPDHPLRWQLEDCNAAQVSRDEVWLWARILDVDQALTARRWPHDGEIVLRVDDPFLDQHTTHLLTIRNGIATCGPTDRTPDFTVDIADLGSLFLGGVAPSTLIRAGRTHVKDDEITALADKIFRTDRAPYCFHTF